MTYEKLSQWCANQNCSMYEVCDLCMYEKGKEDTINKFVCNAITEFQKFDKEHGYPTLADISVILSDVAEQLKEDKE